ncbi:TonB-dependent receptor [Spongiibacter sp. KMU-158]|uniref:TonB-dependent receptor n=1 Tax=Spongiibacter pelagi TaxID=2760804 RepID=A0A927C3G4_9GAMM|nr:TonB-dependent receptor [Spongiibacter pelagi]MBD2859463.1 TonB-dependent receptor [Spongiibacter pelagi]
MQFKQSLSSWLVGASFVLISSASVAAELAEQAPEKAAEEVIVTASRIEKPLSTIPNTVTVINQLDLERQLAIQNDLSTVLGNLIPSFAPSRQKMTSAGESMRGRKPLYLIDGIPQSNPLRSGGRDGHTISPFMLERVEVLHGANAIHGLGASGGIINLITKRPSDELEQRLRVDMGFQSEDVSESLDYGVNYSISNRIDQADVLASIGYRKNGMAYDADGELIGIDNTQGDTMAAEEFDVFLKSGYNWGEQRIEFMFNHFNVESDNEWASVAGDVATGKASGAVRSDLPGEGARNKVSTFSLNYQHGDFLGHSLSAQLFRQDFEATYGAESTPLATFQDPAYGPDLLDQSQNNSEKTGAKFTLSKASVAGLPLSLVYGLDVLQDETWQALIQTGRTWVPESRYNNIAPFVQAEYTGVENLTVTTGVRYEESKLEVGDFTTLASYGSQFVEGGKPEFSETLYNIGATYQFTDTWRAFANNAEAFSMPDVGRVLRGINQPNLSVESFLDLKPILTENTELGVEYDNGTVNMQLSYYISDSDFGQRLQRGSDGVYTVKREKTEVDGLEFRATWAATEQDVMGLRYAQSEGRYDSDQDGKVDSDLGGTNISPDRLNVSWDRNWSEGVKSRLQVNHLRDRKVEDSSGAVTNRFNGYTTVDASVDVAVGQGSVSFSVQNLTNKDYFTYYSQSSPNNLRNFKGIGRSVGIAYQLNF